MKDRLIRDRIIAGISNPDYRQKLLSMTDPSLNNCIKACKAPEATLVQSRRMQEVREVYKQRDEINIDIVDAKQNNFQQQQNRRNQRNYCYKCGGNHGMYNCPAQQQQRPQNRFKKKNRNQNRNHQNQNQHTQNQYCSNCDERNQMDACCPNKQHYRAYCLDVAEESDENCEDVQIHTVNVDQNSDDDDDDASVGQWKDS